MAELPPINARLDGPFRTNVRRLLSEVAEPQPCCLAGTTKWKIAFSDGQGGTDDLLVFEEDVEKTGKLYCEQCRVIGWGHHPVSCSRFHFILPSPNSAAVLDTAERCCPSCEATCPAVSTECPQCGADLRRTSVLEVQSHLLHGVLHSNGSGHLMRINGRERGSRVLSGGQLMDLWDRLCYLLKARDVSVQDVSKKYGLDFRLLHAVAYGSTWYGRWGYKFGRGSFGVSESAYSAAIALLQSLPLATISEHFEMVDHMVPVIIARYQKLSRGQVRTLAELYRFMLELRPKLPDGTGGENTNGLARAAERGKGSRKSWGKKGQSGKGIKGRLGGSGAAQKEGRFRGFLQRSLSGIARARTQNTRRPAKGLKGGLMLRIGVGKGNSSPSKPFKQSAHSPAGSPVKLSSTKTAVTSMAPKKRRVDHGAREESPAPRRTRQRLEDEARFLGLSGAGFKRDGSLDSEAALRRKAKRARLDSERGEQERAGGRLEPQGGGLSVKSEPDVTDDVSMSREVGGGAQGEQPSAPANGDVMGVPPWVRDPSPIPGAEDAAHESKPTISASGNATPQTPMTGRNKKRPPKHGRRTPQGHVDPQQALQLSYSPPEKTPEREVGESGRPAGKPPIKEGSMSKLVRTFESSRESTRSPSVDSGKSRYTPRRIDDAIKALVSIMRTLPGNTWMTRVSLKERARSKIGDTGLLNYALRVVENLEVGDGAVVRRMVHPDSHVMEYRLEKAGDEPSIASPSGTIAASGAAGQASRTADVCTEAASAGENNQEQEGGQPAACANLGSETSGGGCAVLNLQGEQAGGINREAREEATVEEIPRAKEGGGSKHARRRVDLPPIHTEGLALTSGESGKERKQIRKREEKTAAGPGDKLVRADSGWRAERPRRAAVALSPQKITPGAVADASLEKLSKQDVLKDLRYLHQQVVLTYKAARKIRRAGSINPAVASAPMISCGGDETRLGNAPLGASNRLQLERDTEQGDVQEPGLTVDGFEGGLGGESPETTEQKVLDGEKKEEERNCGHADGKETKDEVADACTEKRDGRKVEQSGEGQGCGLLVRAEGKVLGKEPNQGAAEGANVDSRAGLDRGLQGGSVSQEAGGMEPEGVGEMEEIGGSGGKGENGLEQIGKVVLQQSRRIEEGQGDGRNGGNFAGLEVEGAGGNGLSGGVHIYPHLVDPVAVLRASKAIHNTKKLIKSYYWEAATVQCQLTEPSEMRVLFGVKLQDPGPNPRAKCNPPPELLALPASATFKDLKLEAGRAFQEMYVMMRRFRVTRVEGMGGTSDKAQVAPLLAKERNRKLEREGSKAGGWTSKGSAGKEGLPELAADVMKIERQFGLDEERVVQEGETTGKRSDGHVPATLPFEDLQRKGPSVLQPGGDEKDERREEASKKGTEGVDVPRGGALAEQNGVGGSHRGETALTNTDAAELGGTDVHLPPSGGPFPSPQEPPIWHLTGTGAGADLGSEARFEAGLENWVVDCLCGTKDDDGERMAECDKCGTWMHTRCLKIRDRDSVPALVVCPRCCPGGGPKPKGKGVKKAGKGSEKGFRSQSKPSVTQPPSKVNVSPGRNPQASLGSHFERGSMQQSAQAPGQDGPGKALGLTWHTKWGRNGTNHKVPRGLNLLGGKKRSKRDLRAQLDGKGKGGGDKQVALGHGALTHMNGAPEAMERGGAGAPVGVKRKRSTAGGERRVCSNLEHLKAAVWDLAGVDVEEASAGIRSPTLKHSKREQPTKPGMTQAPLVEAAQIPKSPPGRMRSHRGVTNAQAGHPPSGPRGDAKAAIEVPPQDLAERKRAGVA